MDNDSESPIVNVHGVENSNLLATVLKAIQPLAIQYLETIFDDKFPVGRPPCLNTLCFHAKIMRVRRDLTGRCKRN